jgi:hypothetical protein
MTNQMRPAELTGLDAELYAALAECGRIIETMTWDARGSRVDDALERIGLGEPLTPGSRSRDFVVGVMLTAHQRRIFDEQWQRAQPTREQHEETERRDLWLHVVSRHAALFGPDATLADLRDYHRHEHHGPGTIRNHDLNDRSWSPAELNETLSEAER